MHILQRFAAALSERFRARCSCLAVIPAICVMLSSGPACAQESGRSWTVAANNTTYPTQEKAESAMRSINADYARLREIRSSKIYEDRVETTYWSGSDPEELAPWKYSDTRTYDTGPYYSSQDDVIASMISEFDSISRQEGCQPDTKIDYFSGKYSFVTGWSDGTPSQEQSDNIQFYVKRKSGENCYNKFAVRAIWRKRTRCNDPRKIWQDDNGRCEDRTLYPPIVAPPLACSACSLVGDPVDVSTGDQFETEKDFDLGWVEFERYYHSAASNNAGIFGSGWTHSQAFRLAVDGVSSSSPVVGYIRPNGSHLSFKSYTTGIYEATDDSGIRVYASGANWILYAPGETITFNAKGQPLIRSFEDGTSLSYAFDAASRLASITHSSGRSLTFNYADGSSNAQLASITSAGVALATYGYTAGRQVATATYAGNDVRKYLYEDSRFPQHLTGIVAEGNVRFATFAYDTQGRAVCGQQGGGSTCNATSPGVNKTLVTYTSAGGAVVKDPLGHDSTYGLTPDAGGKPRQVNGIADTDGTNTRSIGRTYYDESTDFRRRLDTVTDRNGVQTKHTYAEITDPVTQKPASVHTTVEAVGTPQARTLVERRDLASNRVITRLRGNMSMRIVRNARLQPSTVTLQDTVTASNVRTTTYAYCEAADVAASGSTCPILGLPKSINGPRTDVADITTYTYYPSDDASCVSAPATCPHRKGDLWKVTNALGHVVETLSYDAAGRPTSIKDANGVVTDLEYTPRGWLSASKLRGPTAGTETDDRISRIEYWPTGLVKKVTDPTDAFASFTYDAAQRLTDITDNAGNTIHYTLDAAGNRRQEDTKTASGTLKRTLSRVYNSLGQLTTQADAQSNPTDLTYDPDGNPVTVTDALSHRTRQGYDALDRLASTLEDEGGLNLQTRIEYDALDRPTQVTDPRQQVTGYTYNGFGEVTAESSPDRKATAYTYDSAGNLRTRTDARNVTLGYDYDALNRVTRTTGPSGIQTFTYDTCTNGKGRLCATTAPNADTQFTYARDGQVATRSEIMTVGGAKTNYPTTYTYDVAGRLTVIAYPNGMKVGYGYTFDRPTSMTVTQGTVSSDIVRNATYEPFGPVNAWTYGNTMTRRVSYDTDGQPIGISSNATGPLQSLTYRYDPVERIDKVTNAANTGLTLDYVYDAASRLHQYSSVGFNDTWTYGHDAVGNRTQAVLSGKSSRTDSYAVAADSNRLDGISGGQSVTLSYDPAGNTTGGYGQTFAYDSFNHLTSVNSGATVVGSYAYNVFHERVGKQAGTLLTRYVYAPGSRLLSEHLDNGNVWTNYLWFGGELVGIVRNGQIVFVHTDHQGRPELATDGVKAVVWKANNYPFTRSVQVDTIGGLNVGFPGQYYDAESKLWYNVNRYYDANTGRYLQVDPLGLGAGVNPYSYVDGNPINDIDPFGLEAEANWFDPHGRGTYYQSAVNYYSPPGTFTIATHGVIGRPLIKNSDGKDASAQKVWDRIKDRYKAGGYKKIRVAACEAGRDNSSGENFLRDLARISGEPVEGTRYYVGYPENGNLFIV